MNNNPKMLDEGEEVEEEESSNSDEEEGDVEQAKSSVSEEEEVEEKVVKVTKKKKGIYGSKKAALKRLIKRGLLANANDVVAKDLLRGKNSNVYIMM